MSALLCFGRVWCTLVRLRCDIIDNSLFGMLKQRFQNCKWGSHEDLRTQSIVHECEDSKKKNQTLDKFKKISQFSRFHTLKKLMNIDFFICIIQI